MNVTHPSISFIPYLKNVLCKITYLFYLKIYINFHISDKPIKFIKLLPQICFIKQPISLF